MTKFTYHGGMNVEIECGNGYRILCDPFIRKNPHCTSPIEHFYGADLILVTHATYDHYGDVAELLKNSNAKVICGRESWAKIQGEYAEIDAERFIPTIYGDCRTVDGVEVHTVQAWHSSGVMIDGIRHNYCPFGFIVMPDPGVRYYHTGDTAITAESGMIRDLYHPNVMVVGISGISETGPREMTAEQAARMVGIFAPNVAIPSHYRVGDPALREFSQVMRYFAPYTEVAGEIGRQFEFVPAEISYA